MFDCVSIKINKFSHVRLKLDEIRNSYGESLPHVPKISDDKFLKIDGYPLNSIFQSKYTELNQRHSIYKRLIPDYKKRWHHFCRPKKLHIESYEIE